MMRLKLLREDEIQPASLDMQKLATAGAALHSALSSKGFVHPDDRWIILKFPTFTTMRLLKC